jgi:hypothetical protein
MPRPTSVRARPALVGNLSASQRATVTAGANGDVYLARGRETWHLTRKELAQLAALAAAADSTETNQ